MGKKIKSSYQALENHVGHPLEIVKNAETGDINIKCIHCKEVLISAGSKKGKVGELYLTEGFALHCEDYMDKKIVPILNKGKIVCKYFDRDLDKENVFFEAYPPQVRNMPV